MRIRVMWSALVVGISVLGMPPVADAQQSDPDTIRREIEQLRKELADIQKSYGERLAALEAEVTALTAAAAPESAQAPPAPQPVTQPSLASGSKVFNPDIAVIGNVVATGGSNAVESSPALELREAELAFQAAVDPYARADFFISVSPEHAGVEEGFVTFPTLPGGLLLKVGQMREAFGKINGLHPHVLPWPDLPLVMRNLLGGEEGLSDAGISMARLIPNPWFFLEATGQVFRGTAGDVFEGSRASDLSYVARLRGYGDLNESTNIDLGTSWSVGHNSSGITDGTDDGRFRTQLFGVDATVRYKPLRRAIYRSFVGRAELVWSRRQQPGGLQAALGYFVSGDYQFARRWFAGLRYDHSGRPDMATVVDTGGALVLTFMPSEFSQLRGMYRRTRYARTTTANEFLFQVQFAIGAHGAHPF
jgi:hypothetical protein